MQVQAAPAAIVLAGDAAHFMPRLGLALLILAVGALIGRAAVRALTTALQRAGFVQLVERGTVRKVLSRSKYDAATVVGKALHVAFLALVLAAALTVLGADDPATVLVVLLGAGAVLAVRSVDVPARIAAGSRAPRS